MNLFIRRRLNGVLCVACLFSGQAVFSQWTLTASPTLTSPTNGATVGTSGGLSALSVHVDETGANPQEPFRTRVAATTNSNWRMFRDAQEMGRVYSTAINQSFNIQAVQSDGNMWMRNSSGDGFRLNWNGTQATQINGWDLVTKAFAALGDVNAINDVAPNAPWARLHLMHPAPTSAFASAGWRNDWINGILFQGNNDLAFIGHKYYRDGSGNEILDRSDLIITASENSLSETTRQRIRFTYTTTPTSATTGAANYNGLEFMQCWPETATQGYVGIGDFYAATVQNGGVEVYPTERLDLVNGRLRIRDLPNNNALSNATKMMVVNSNGIVGWQSIGGAAFSCEWEVTSGAKKITTAYQALASNGTCPELDWRVGIGTNAPQAKLHSYVGPDDGLDLAVKAESEGLNANGTLSSYALGAAGYARNAYVTTGVYGEGRMPLNTDGYLNSNSNVIGVSGLAQIEGKTYQSYGGKFTSKLTNDANAQATEVYGAYCLGQTTQTSYPTELFGVKGLVLRPSGNSNRCVAVYGDAPVNPSGAPLTSWAAWFQGDGMLSASIWQYSDADLKQNMQPLEGCGDILAQVNPYGYLFNTAQYPTFGLPEGPQAGIKADELLAAIPHLVRNVLRPADHDSLGNETAPAMEVQVVNYIGLIPYLLGAVRELKQENSAMQEQLAACCATNDDGTRMHETGGIGYIDNTQRATEAGRQVSADELVVTPNPFTENPTISYRIGTSGRAQLRVSSASSRDMGVLYDAGTEAGQHSMVWNTVGMAPGLYLLTLTVDGKRVTEQAVKVE